MNTNRNVTATRLIPIQLQLISQMLDNKCKCKTMCNTMITSDFWQFRGCDDRVALLNKFATFWLVVIGAAVSLGVTMQCAVVVSTSTSITLDYDYFILAEHSPPPIMAAGMRKRGFSIRCLLPQPISQSLYNYMRHFSMNQAARMIRSNYWFTKLLKQHGTQK